MTLAAPAAGDQSSLDPTFSRDGVQRLALVDPSDAHVVLVDRAGRYLVSGVTGHTSGSTDEARAVLARFLRSGSLDPSFGEGGLVLSPTVAYPPSIPQHDLALASGDRILLLVAADGGHRVEAYRPSGQPDAAFGSGGIVNLPTGTIYRQLHLDSAGRIVLVGQRFDVDESRYVINIIRLLPGGGPDLGFGNGGSTEFIPPGRSCDASPYFPAATAVASDLAGRVLIAGASSDALPPRCVIRVSWLARLGAGMFDSNFGTSGFALYDVGDGSIFNALALDDQERIIAAGDSEYPVYSLNSDAAVYRLLDNGMEDPSFLTYLRETPISSINGVALDKAGRILIAGYGGLRLGRLLASGLPDRSFGRGGYSLENIPTDIINAKSLALDPGGGVIVAADRSPNFPDSFIAVARFGSPCSGLGVIRGTPLEDRLRGTNLSDVIATYAGDDRVDGGPGSDAICARSGADRIRGGLDGDLLQLGGGADRGAGQAGNDHLLGEAGPDRLVGGAGADVLLGRAGEDLLVGGRGRDICFGGPGHDRAFGCEVRRRMPGVSAP